VEVAEKDLKLSKSQFFPDWSLGYFNQSIDGMPNMTGVSVGLNLPIFFWAQDGRAKAAKANRDEAMSQLEERKLELESLENSLREQLLKHEREIEWYRESGLKTASELIRFAQKAKDLGEINYIEYLSSFEKAREIHEGHLETLKNFRLLITDWQFLHGQF
jgi:cobalt-zinc-cadmium resistance protein CzcA